jgi:hypothetical protein
MGFVGLARPCTIRAGARPCALTIVADALTTEKEPRYCSRCGTALVAGLPFCPRCGLKNADDGDDTVKSVPDGSPAVNTNPTHAATDTRPVGAAITTTPRRPDRGLGGNPKLWSALIVVAALVIFDLLTRALAGGAPGPAPGGGSGGGVVPGSSVAAPSALIVGLTIESPRDGQVVATKDITVIGIAPPGLSITRDISFGLDQHATSDGTGHWAINVSLDNGENKLKFRIGDDHSTEQEIRVTYTPQGQ